MGIILQELAELYSAECQGRMGRMEIEITKEPPLQFSQYIEWQEQQSRSKVMSTHESYWLSSILRTQFLS